MINRTTPMKNGALVNMLVQFELSQLALSVNVAW